MKHKSPTLTFEQIESHFHKWARMFQNHMFEHWELINSAWLYGKVRFLPQSKIKFASYRIKCDMIDYMRFMLKVRHKKRAEASGRHFPCINNFSFISAQSPVKDGDGFETTLRAKKDVIDIEQKDLINFLASHPSLTRQEKLIMKLIYIGGYCMKEAGGVCGVSESRVSQVHTNLMKHFKAIDYSKII